MRQLKVTTLITDRRDPAMVSYLDDLHNCIPLTVEEETEVAAEAFAGCPKAKAKLVTANLRFVLTVAKQYQNRHTDILDLVQAGNKGLIRAAEKFDPTRGFKFISYAIWWIRQSILQEIKSHRTVRLPENKIKAVSDYKKELSKAFAETGVNNVSYDLRNTPIIEISLNGYERTNKNEDGRELWETMEDTSERTDQYETEDQNRMLEQIISHMLDSRTKYIMVHRYGLFGAEKFGDEALAHILDLTVVRIQQIHNRAIKQLRNTMLHETESTRA